MAVCEIKVHSTDNTRMELIIPGEQHFYVKAVNAAERQRWLVALGSSKASLPDTRTRKEKEISETNESLNTKMSELRLYCDLLMQQVHTIQEFVSQDENRPSPSAECLSFSSPVLYSTTYGRYAPCIESTLQENMNEASSLLSATCNTFITTLEECVKIANAKFKPEMYQLPPRDSLVSAVSPSPVQMMKRSMSHPGTYTSERINYSLKDPVSSFHRVSHRRRSAYSETENFNDVFMEDLEKPAHWPRIGINGDLPPANVPEESRHKSRKPSDSAESLAPLSS
ncbi:hypothetical protein FKM82_015678 [Ascaphus truei]